MTILRAVRKLVLGETWALPLGVGALIAVAVVLRSASWWPGAGGFVLLGGAVAVLGAVIGVGAARGVRR